MGEGVVLIIPVFIEMRQRHIEYIGYPEMSNNHLEKIRLLVQLNKLAIPHNTIIK